MWYGPIARIPNSEGTHWWVGFQETKHQPRLQQVLMLLFEESKWINPRMLHRIWNHHILATHCALIYCNIYVFLNPSLQIDSSSFIEFNILSKLWLFGSDTSKKHHILVVIALDSYIDNNNLILNFVNNGAVLPITFANLWHHHCILLYCRGL